MSRKNFDIIVVGAGHAGVEAALASARLGSSTLLITLNMEAISFMACNPSIGGTAKGHLVREVDALGGQMGISADKTLLQIRMLNTAKGAAVQSLRGQQDKNYYHRYNKLVLEQQENLELIQAEVNELIVEDGTVKGVKTTLGLEFGAKAVVLATGVYLQGKIIIGEFTEDAGPAGFKRAVGLTQNLIDNGLEIRRFKTGTPCRVDGKTIDYSKTEKQDGDKLHYSFSFMTDNLECPQIPCYLTYTNEKTHEIIRKNFHRAPLFSGTIKGIGPRYCPSIEDKVNRFKDKERHQLFLEPEGADTNEVYVQGLSSSLPVDVQEEMLHTIPGLENAKIIRYAYAIEYDCLNPLELLISLETKKIHNLFTAGQINGSSGYEEAAAQGLIAGINAHQKINNKEPLILQRNESYIGVLIDDLVTKGTNEPYRMMTSRAEYRLILRQDNADIRLTQKGRDIGLVTDERFDRYLKKLENIKKTQELLKEKVGLKELNAILEEKGMEKVGGNMSFENAMIRRYLTIDDIYEKTDLLKDIPYDAALEVAVEIRYRGYLDKQNLQIEAAKKLEEKILPEDIDYLNMDGIRLEARQKLDKIKPRSLGQAMRISGVSPSDITVLMIYLSKNNN